MRLPNLRSQQGGILAIFGIVLWLIIFFIGMMAVFSYMAGYLRVEIGKLEEESDTIIHDEKTIAVLEKREEVVAEKEQTLRRKEKALRDLERQIAIEKKHIASVQQKVNGDLQQITGKFKEFSIEEQDNMKRLAKLYESMKPNKVALIFAEMDVVTVAELLKMMKSRSSAKILASIATNDAPRAASITRVMQGENKKDAFRESLN